jgi:hypothetical protein
MTFGDNRPALSSIAAGLQMKIPPFTPHFVGIRAQRPGEAPSGAEMDEI